MKQDLKDRIAGKSLADRLAAINLTHETFSEHPNEKVSMRAVMAEWGRRYRAHGHRSLRSFA